MILVDTAVWINHIHESIPDLVTLLNEDQSLIHPFIIGELALGHFKNRERILHDLRSLPHITLATDEEVLSWIEKRRLFGKGIGWVDAHLLLSCLLNNADLWTHDKSLLTAARSGGVKIYSIH